MKIVLITSGGQFLGQHVVKHLQSDGPESLIEIRILDTAPFQQELEYKTRLPVKSFVGTVFDEDVLKNALDGVDTVVHLTEIKDCSMIPDVQTMRKVNVEETAKLVQICEILGAVKYFLLLSSFDVMIPTYTHKVYNMEISDIPVGNWMLQNYAATKFEAEQIVFGSSQFQSFAVRASPMFGELDTPEYSPVITALKVAKYFNGTLPVISACRDGIIQHTYVGNVAYGMVKILEKMQNDPTASKEAIFILDETPFKDFYTLIEPYLQKRNFRLSGRLMWFIPFYMPYMAFEKAVQLLQYCWDVKPYVKKLPSSKFLYNYLHNWILFNGLKALTYIGYKPKYPYSEAVRLSSQYYSTVAL